MTDEEKAALAERVAEWAESHDGKKSLTDTMHRVRQMRQEAEQKARDDMVALAEYGRKPMTI